MNEEEQVEPEKTPEETKKPARKWIAVSYGLLAISIILTLIGKISERTEVKEEFRQVDRVSTRVAKALKAFGVNQGRKYLAKVSQEYPASYIYDNGDRFAQVFKSGYYIGRQRKDRSMIFFTSVRSRESAEESGGWIVEEGIKIEQVSFTEDGLLVGCHFVSDEGTSSSQYDESVIPWERESQPSSGLLCVVGGVLILYPDSGSLTQKSFATLAEKYPQYCHYDQDSRFVQLYNRRSPAKNEQDHESVLLLRNVGSPESAEKMAMWTTRKGLRVEGVSFTEEGVRVRCNILNDDGTSSSQYEESLILWDRGSLPQSGSFHISGGILVPYHDFDDQTKENFAVLAGKYPQYCHYDQDSRFMQVCNRRSPAKNEQEDESVLLLRNVGSPESTEEMAMWTTDKGLRVEGVSFTEDGVRVRCNILNDDGTSSSQYEESLILWDRGSLPQSGCFRISGGILFPYHNFDDQTKENFAVMAGKYPQYCHYDQDSRFVQVCNRRSPSKNERDYESVLVLSSAGSTESVEMGQWMTERNLRVEGVAFVGDEMRVNCALLNDDGTSSSEKREYRIPWKKGTDPDCGILLRSGEILSEFSDGKNTGSESVPADSI
jgi:hypothetical protein